MNGAEASRLERSEVGVGFWMAAMRESQ